MFTVQVIRFNFVGKDVFKLQLILYSNKDVDIKDDTFLTLF